MEPYSPLFPVAFLILGRYHLFLPQYLNCWHIDLWYYSFRPRQLNQRSLSCFLPKSSDNRQYLPNSYLQYTFTGYHAQSLLFSPLICRDPLSTLDSQFAPLLPVRTPYTRNRMTVSKYRHVPEQKDPIKQYYPLLNYSMSFAEQCWNICCNFVAASCWDSVFQISLMSITLVRFAD